MIIGISGKIGSGKDTTGKIIQYLTTVKEYQKSRTFEQFLHDCNGNGFAEQTHTWKIKKFAYKLKQVCSLLTGIPVEDFEKQEVKDSLLGEEWKRWSYNRPTGAWDDYDLVHFSSYKEAVDNVKNSDVIIDKEYYIKEIKEFHPTVRWLLQTIGTDAMRNVIHENVWVNALFADYKEEFIPRGIGNFHDPRPSYKSIGFPNWIITDLRFLNELKAVEDRHGITIRVRRHELYKDANDVLHIAKSSEKAHPSETALDNANFKYTIENNGTIEELIEKVKEVLIKEKII